MPAATGSADFTRSSPPNCVRAQRSARDPATVAPGWIGREPTHHVGGRFHAAMRLCCNEIGDRMQVEYSDNSLERLCTDEKEMKKRRADIADKLKLRIKALQAAPNLGALPEQDPLGRWHPLTGDRAGTWAGSVSRNHRIIIRPDGDEPGVDSVTVTVIAAGEDYH